MATPRRGWAGGAGRLPGPGRRNAREPAGHSPV